MGRRSGVHAGDVALVRRKSSLEPVVPTSSLMAGFYLDKISYFPSKGILNILS